jgi:16S rRNA (adenine1518-N6/adenine1519-N6)-dimethyltransferase
LIDKNIIQKILSASKVERGDLVVEVGSGPGCLSEALLERGASLLAIEKDLQLAKALERFNALEGQLEIIQADILDLPIPDILHKRLHEGKKAKFIANLPYHLTTPILAQFITMHTLFSSLTVMVQEEVARRMVALPGSKEYGSLSLFLSFYAQMRYAFSVSNRCFYPVPRVQSAVVVLELRDPPLVSDVVAFFKMTRLAFCHRRKMLRASLRPLYAPALITASLQFLQLPLETRPEQLSLQQFLMLFELLQKEIL